MISVALTLTLDLAIMSHYLTVGDLTKYKLPGGPIATLFIKHLILITSSVSLQLQCLVYLGTCDNLPSHVTGLIATAVSVYLGTCDNLPSHVTV